MPLFASLDPKTKGAIAAALGQVSMPKGTAVVTQVSPASFSYSMRAEMFDQGPACSTCPLKQRISGACIQLTGQSVKARPSPAYDCGVRLCHPLPLTAFMMLCWAGLL